MYSLLGAGRHWTLSVCRLYAPVDAATGCASTGAYIYGRAAEEGGAAGASGCDAWASIGAGGGADVGPSDTSLTSPLSHDSYHTPEEHTSLGAQAAAIAERMRQVQTDSEQRQQKVSRTINQDQGYSELKERGLVTHTPAAVDSPDDHVQHTAADELEKMDLSGMGLVQTRARSGGRKTPDAASFAHYERLRASKQAYTRRREEVTALAPTNEQQRRPREWRVAGARRAR